MVLPGFPRLGLASLSSAGDVRVDLRCGGEVRVDSGLDNFQLIELEERLERRGGGGEQGD